jgi:putative phosphoesterase
MQSLTLQAMVIAVISDTHLPRGARRIPDACVERMRASDLVIHAGDISTREVLEDIADTAGKKVHAVYGNVDSAELRNTLPESRILDAEGAKIAVVHDAGPATGRLKRMRKRFPAADAVVFGHSHIPLHEQDETGFQIFNPGSPTDRRRQPQHTMGIARANDGKLDFELVTLA